MCTKQVPAGRFCLVCVRKAADACPPRTWQRASHPASAGTGRRATAPVHSQVPSHEPPLRLVMLWAPCPTVCPPRSHPPSDLTASVVKINFNEPGEKGGKRALVLRDPTLSVMAEEKACPRVVSTPGGSDARAPGDESGPAGTLRSGLIAQKPAAPTECSNCAPVGRRVRCRDAVSTCVGTCVKSVLTCTPSTQSKGQLTRSA